MKQILAGLMFFAGLPAVGVAQGSPLTNDEIMSRLANVSSQPEVEAKLVAIFGHDEERLSGCTNPGKPVPYAITVFETPKFSAEFLEAGVWQMRYNVAVCGENRRRTALFRVANGENLSLTSLLPGDTLADMNLQSDVRTSMFKSAIKIAPQCATPQIIHTQVTAKPTDVEAPWQEIWTGEFCGKKVAQTIDFTPNSQGTAFSMALIK